MRRFNRVRWKLAGSLAGVVILTMGVSFLVFDRLVSRALGISLNPDVALALDRGLDARRRLFEGWKRTFRATARGHARDVVLVGAVEAGDREAARRILASMLEEEPDGVLFVLETGTGDPVVASRPESEHPEASWRSFDVEFPVGGSGARLSETYVVPWEDFHAFEEDGRVRDTYHAAREVSRDLRVAFLLYWLVTVGALSVIVGGGVFLYSLRLGRRIGRLSQATERVARGDLDFAIKDGAGDELSDLVQAFDRMVREIREGRERIEYLQKVSAWQEFARRLAHEIKNPLTPIQLAIQEVKSTYKGDDPRFSAVLDESYEIIEEEITVLRRLVGEFSSFARLPAVEAAPVDLAAFLVEACPSLDSFARSKGVALECRPPARPVQVSLDGTMFRRVLDNLVHNAVEAIERGGKGGGRVVIAASREGGSGHVDLRIVDDGPGIDPSHLGRIFEPYWTSRSEGTGLGLAIAKKIVLEHGGSLSVEATGDGGTTFRIVLPVRGRS